VYGAKNCTVPAWNFYLNTWSDCTTQCGGTQTITRTVSSYGEAGGEPCPALSWNRRCGNNYCAATMVIQGYYYWGPFCSGATTRTVNYRFRSDRDIDLYVFDAPDFIRYSWDASLIKPLNAYYQPAFAHLNTNFEIDTFTVPANKCYYMVLDNTNVGATKTRDDDQDGVPDTFNVYFSFQGINTNDGFTDFSQQYGVFQPASASQLSMSFFGAFLTVLTVLVLKLE